MRLPARHCSIRHRHAAPLSCADERPPPDVFVLAGDVASSLLYGAVESATDGWLVVAEGRDAATDPDVLPLPLLQAGELAVWWVLCGLLIGAYDPAKTRGDVVRALTAAAQTWVVSCALLLGGLAFLRNVLDFGPGLMQIELDFFTGSLSVLGAWRLVAAQLPAPPE